MLFHAVAAGGLAGALAGCGGGGGDAAADPASPVPAPVPAPVSAGPLAAVLSVPDPVGYDADRRAVFDRLNQVRLSAGLGMVAQQAQMDAAAQAHAQWEVANDVLSHQEVAGTAGFSGVGFTDRELAQGYAPVDALEVACSGAAALECVDLLVNTAYHRIGVLAFEPVDVGIGRSALAAADVSQPVVIDLASPGTDPVRGLGQQAQAAIAGLAIWPLEGATDVPLRMGVEIPDPVPGVDVGTLGTPVSVTVAQSREITGASFSMARADDGSAVALAVLDRQHDANGLVPPSYAVAVPLAPLQAATGYVVTFKATLADIPGGAPVAVSRRWSFTTAQR